MKQSSYLIGYNLNVAFMGKFGYLAVRIVVLSLLFLDSSALPLA